MQLSEEELIKNISIKGRFAFAMKCLEKVLEERREINLPVVQKILFQLWKFTESQRLDLWEEEIKGFDPGCLLEDDNYEDYSFPAVEEIVEIKAYYLSISLAVREMFEDVIAIGTINLYGGTGEYSESTFKYTIKVLKIARILISNVPDINSFSRFRFSDYHGWGNAFHKNEVI